MDSELLQDYIARFWGYGNPSGKYWFVGIEEGGGNNLETRLQAWDRRGRRPIVDLHDLHQELKVSQFSGPKPKRLQRTWRRLIEAHLVAEGDDQVERLTLREFQGTKLGTKTGDTCLIELFPLPCSRTETWPYAKCSDLPWLCDKPTYQKHIVSKRCSALTALIQKHRPATVTFYGRSFRGHWNCIVDQSFALVRGYLDIEEATIGSTQCFLVPHPTGRKVRRDLFKDLGRIIRTRRSTS